MLRTKTLATVLFALAVPSVNATIQSSYISVADTTYYTYVYTNTEEPLDWITALHLYAPADPAAVSGWVCPDGWNYTVTQDATFGGIDICWYAIDPDSTGIYYNDSSIFGFTSPSSYRTVTDFVLPDFPLGNWGYETRAWSGYNVFVMLPSVPVPQAAEDTVAPEPATLAALLFGLLVLARRKN